MSLRNRKRAADDDGLVVDMEAAGVSAASWAADDTVTDLSARLAMVAFEADVDAEKERYGEWAGRLRDKQAKAKAAFVPPATRANYWSAELLLEHNEDEVDDDIVLTDADIAGSWAVLGLEEGTSADELTRAFRTLVKAHHPDRFVGEDDATQAIHADQLRRVVRAYRRLTEVEVA